jgi:hypothetical protein
MTRTMTQPNPTDRCDRCSADLTPPSGEQRAPYCTACGYQDPDSADPPADGSAQPLLRRYQRCVRSLCGLFDGGDPFDPRDPFPHFLIDRLETMITHGMLAPAQKVAELREDAREAWRQTGIARQTTQAERARAHRAEQTVRELRGADALAKLRAMPRDDVDERAALLGIVALHLMQIDPDRRGVRCSSINQTLYPARQDDGLADVRAALEKLTQARAGCLPEVLVVSRLFARYKSRPLPNGLRIRCAALDRSTKLWTAEPVRSAADPNPQVTP